MDYRHLLEARIRDFQQRKAQGDVRPAPKTTAGGSLESTLITEIRDLRKQAKETDDADEKAALAAESQALVTQLSVLLESSGRPLAARLLADRLNEE